MIHERTSLDFVLMGILHGAMVKNCRALTAKTPSLFANLEEAGNLEFVTKWKNLGDFFLSDNLDDLERETNVSINYLKHLPHKVQQSLWKYTDNDYIYAILYFKICKNSSFANKFEFQKSRDFVELDDFLKQQYQKLAHRS